MASQPIGYSKPTSKAYARMKYVLFQSADIGKWFVLGFAAWLSQLFEWKSSVLDLIDWRPVMWWARQNVEWAIIIGSVLGLVGLVVGLALLWVRSRAKFIFLDNLVHNRAQVKAPWRQFRMQGNSLFIWDIAFLFIVFAGISGFGMALL